MRPTVRPFTSQTLDPILIPIDPSKMSDINTDIGLAKKTKKRTPTGGCNKEEHRSLQMTAGDKFRTGRCSYAKKCLPSDDCDELKRKRDNLRDCGKASKNINKICYRGENDTHRDEAGNEAARKRNAATK